MKFFLNSRPLYLQTVARSPLRRRSPVADVNSSTADFLPGAKSGLPARRTRKANVKHTDSRVGG